MTKQTDKRSPAATAAQERARTQDDIRTLSTGVQARIVPVAASLIADVTSRIKDPQMPMVTIEGKKRPEPNPDDPEYKAELEEAGLRRAKATMDTIVMFGIELIEGVPSDNGWLGKLKYMERLGHLDLEEYKLDDAIDQEFLYKRYVAVSAEDMTEVMRRSGVTEEAIADATDNFPSS